MGRGLDGCKNGDLYVEKVIHQRCWKGICLVDARCKDAGTSTVCLQNVAGGK